MDNANKPLQQPTPQWPLPPSSVPSLTDEQVVASLLHMNINVMAAAVGKVIHERGEELTDVQVSALCKIIFDVQWSRVAPVSK